MGKGFTTYLRMSQSRFWYKTILIVITMCLLFNKYSNLLTLGFGLSRQCSVFTILVVPDLLNNNTEEPTEHNLQLATKYSLCPGTTTHVEYFSGIQQLRIKRNVTK